MEVLSKRSDFMTLLLGWYNANVRPFPWRSTCNPYQVWLSEIMLQQTQVKTVIPFYNRWVAKFPTIKYVAETNMDSLLKMWEGLGYYARVRNFHSACIVVMGSFGGKIPNNYQDFHSLPGVGPYVAGAVMSIAYNFPIPAIDGNAFRVVSRIKSINLPFNRCKNQIFGFLTDHISPKRPGDFNQAIMDLGREICTSKNPSCDICPIRKYCCAFVNNSVDKYPFRAKRQKKPHYTVAVGVVWKGNKILISKRRENGLLGGLWEFPGGKTQNDEDAKKCVIRKINEKLGVQVRPGRLLKQIKHSYSHFSITLNAFHCDYVCGSPRALQCDNWQWILPEQITSLPFSKANHKLFNQIQGD